MPQTADTTRVVLAQFNPLVGDILGNCELIIRLSKQAQANLAADLVVFPELALLGYPPEDLLLRPGLRARVEQAVEHLCQAVPDLDFLIGTPWWQEHKLYNAALWIRNGAVHAHYFKQCLPNYGVFDEKRYFTAGTEPVVVEHRGQHFGLTICEDLWEPAPASSAKDAGANILLSLNGSPYHRDQSQQRLAELQARVHETQLPLFYVNQVGGQDELIFDGASMLLDANAQVLAQALSFQEQLMPIDINTQMGIDQNNKDQVQITAPGFSAMGKTDELAEIYAGLVMGVRDYVHKNGFEGAVLGLSGGIDSALTLALAVDALGAEHVLAVMMPSRYTSDLSQSAAAEQCEIQDVAYRVIAIEQPFQAFLDVLKDSFAGLPKDTSEENIQARCRGVILMALSNKTGRILLTTGNKSEMAVGYATLYGDMAGGFAPLKDVEKTLVYALANYRNTHNRVIPQIVIDRPPSAELAPDQKDSDSLPDYDVLDKILRLYVEQDLSHAQIIGQGFDQKIVEKVIRMVVRNEYKRRQAPPGIKISPRAFGRDRRYPLTSGYDK